MAEGQHTDNKHGHTDTRTIHTHRLYILAVCLETGLRVKFSPFCQELGRCPTILLLKFKFHISLYFLKFHDSNSKFHIDPQNPGKGFFPRSVPGGFLQCGPVLVAGLDRLRDFPTTSGSDFDNGGGADRDDDQDSNDYHKDPDMKS